jgi:hypothetical protein
MSASGLTNPLSSVVPIVEDARALVKLETAIVEAAELHLDDRNYVAFAARQSDLTEAIIGGCDDDANFETFISSLCRVLDVDTEVALRPNTGVMRCVVAATPIIRSELVFRPVKASVDQAALTLDRVPYLLTALSVIVELAHQAGMRKVTYQTVMRLFADNVELLAVLAHLSCRTVWGPTEMIDLSMTGGDSERSRYAAILKALLPAQQRNAQRTLAEILCSHIEVTGLDRLTCLRSVARRLNGRIMSMSEANKRRSRPGGLRPLVQQWALSKLGQEQVMRLGARQ